MSDKFKALVRETVRANLMDGQEGGLFSMEGSALCDAVADAVEWAVQGYGDYRVVKLRESDNYMDDDPVFTIEEEL